MKTSKALLLFLVCPPLAAQAQDGRLPPPGEAVLELQVEHLRNARGMIRVCLTQRREHFPDCANDPHAITATVPADEHTIRLGGFAPGRYALALFHDENVNQRLDTLLGIPREGFGFSRNPAIGFGAPKFSQVDLELGSGVTRHAVRVKYLL